MAKCEKYAVLYLFTVQHPPEGIPRAKYTLKGTVCPGTFAATHSSKGLISMLKNTHLLRCAHRLALQRTVKYVSFLVISCSLQQDVFSRAERNNFFKNLLGQLLFAVSFQAVCFFRSNVNKFGVRLIGREYWFQYRNVIK